MMNFKALTLAALLGVATPAIADIATNAPAVAQGYGRPTGTFQDNTWEVTLSWGTQGADDTPYYYRGRNKRTGDSISLAFHADHGLGGNSTRPTYTWNNNGTRYQVAWRPSDPNVIRLQIFTPNGRQVLNRLLRR